ncbi:MAG TPA: indolepyruvate ferredoxin oxidoreductase subunit alpha [Dehalococcoidales bacterium]|nr:indolepyruvate ferredoxin oxidoreductase subunit alpha [Dehalococcoidales bacterium]
MVVSEKLTLTSDAPGKSMFMLGNEAIARGAIEAGVQVYAAYPGTPSSEISENLVNLSKQMGFYAEWSVNEQVAFELAFGASMANVRAMTSMKHVGLNVAHDPLMSATYMGARGGFVMVNADDPGQWSSQNEQDNRVIAEQAYIPILEPSSAQEAKDMVVDGFNWSEEFGQIFMLRSVTRLSHGRGDVTLGPIKKEKRKGDFAPANRERFICMPAWSRKNRYVMIERLNKIKAAVDGMVYNKLKLVKGAKVGVIASGISYGYALESLRWLGMEDKVSFLKVGTPYPLPEKLVKELCSSVSKVIVVEELEPFVENHVALICQRADIRVKVYGKEFIPLVGELSTRKVVEGIAKFLDVKSPIDFGAIDKTLAETNPMVPMRPPTLCPGCPHRGSFYAINIAARKTKKDLGERVLNGDIGCYSLGAYAPLFSYDASCCMGGGFGVANGLAKGQSNPVIGHLGDSTFFHSGIPALINAVFNNIKVTLVVLDNSATSMTGFQPNPAAPTNGQPGLKAEEIAKACGVKHIEVVDCFDIKATAEAMERAVRFNGPSVVVARGLCAILDTRNKRQAGKKVIPYSIDQDTCTKCKICVNQLACPAILIENETVVIDAAQCVACGLCAAICPSKSILQGGK